MRTRVSGIAAFVLVSALAGCAGGPSAPEPDVLTQGGYTVDQDDTGNITTGMRQEIRSPWNGLLRWRFGVGKTRVEARVVPQDDSTTRLRLQVFHRGKDGIFDSWEDAETPLPQSAANEIRLLKNALRLL